MRIKTKFVGCYQSYPFHKWSYKYPKKKRLAKKADRNESFNEDLIQELLLLGKDEKYGYIGWKLMTGNKRPARWRLIYREAVKNGEGAIYER